MAPSRQHKAARNQSGQESQGLVRLAEQLSLDREQQKYTDLTIVCDDGSKFNVHKAIVCPQVKAWELAMKPEFIEGSTGQYPIRNRPRRVVEAFLDQLYGKPKPTPSLLEKSNQKSQVFELGLQILALADELQAEGLLQDLQIWCSNVLEVCTVTHGASTLWFISDNVGNSAPILARLQDAFAKIIQKVSVEEIEAYCDFYEEHIDDGISIVKQLVSGGPLQELISDGKYDILQEPDMISLFLKKYCNAGKPSMETMWQDRDFKNAVMKNPDAVDLVVKILLDRRDMLRDGRTRLYFCRSCLSAVMVIDLMERCEACGVYAVFGAKSLVDTTRESSQGQGPRRIALPATRTLWTYN